MDTIHLSNECYPMFVKNDLSGVVPVFMGLGAQEPAVEFTTDTVEAPASKIIRTADLDRDNNVDLVFTTTNDSTLSVAYGNGDGTFISPTDLIAHQSPTGIAFGFIDDDTLLDMIAVDSGEYFVLLNLGGRNSFDVTSYTYTQGTSSNVAQVGYFNADVNADFVATPNTVFYGSATGDFVQTNTLPIDFRSVDVGDFNNDGYDDLLLTILNDSVAIYLNDGQGDFIRSVSIPVDPVSWDTKTGSLVSDFNRDGNLDFAVLIPEFTKQDWGSNIYIALGDGTGAIAEIDTVTINGYASNLEAADVNRDNNLDLLTGTTDHKLHFLFNDGSGEFDLQNPVDLEDGVITDPLVYDDFDRDGNPDILGGAVSEDDWTLAINDNPDAPVVPDEMVVTGFDNASIEVINPDSFVISEDFQTVSGARYYRLDADDDANLDDRTVDYNLQYGEYTIVIRAQEDKDESMEYCSGIEINGTKSATTFLSYPWDDDPDKSPEAIDSVVFYYTYEPTPSFYPENGMKATTSPSFYWGKLADSIFNFDTVDSFLFQLDNYYDFRAPRFDTIVLTDSNITLPDTLHMDSVFYWRIKAFRDLDESEFSRTFALHVTSGCCVYYRGNVNCSYPDEADISDITRLIDFLYISHEPLCCLDEADVDGSGGEPDISDITYLIDHLYLSHKLIPTCP
ncbi:MAG: VCBS repeat-containing protein [candidate division Zixibacteria bacterium]|nr:VCBS repeat-containing protein [candidate division Zixibacteria bacterium]